MKEFKLPIVRHFDEEDNLLLGARDGDLLPGQEQKAKDVAYRIHAEMQNDSQTAVFFITSQKKRTIQTADLISTELQDLNSNVRILNTSEKDLDAIREGEFILPPDYTPGDYFTGLEIASDIFSNEVHGKERGLGTDNYLYRYGDPLLQEDGTYKYPDLLKYFKNPGENYKEVLLRIYNLIIATHTKLHKFTKNTKVVILTHGQPAQIFKDLNAVAEKVQSGALSVEAGQLANLCWQEYQSRDKNERVTGQTDFITIEHLANSDMIDILQQEVSFLEELTK